MRIQAFAHFFLYFRDIFFKCNSYHLKEFSLPLFFSSNQSKNLPPVERACFFLRKKNEFSIFDPNRDLIVRFPHFFVFLTLVRQMWLWPSWITLLYASFGYNLKNIYVVWRKHAFLEKNNFANFSPETSFQNFVFHFFGTSETYFSNNILTSLEDFTLRIFW